MDGNLLVLVVALGAFVAMIIFSFVTRPKQQPPAQSPPAPPPTGNVSLDGIAVRPATLPAKFDPDIHPPFHYPLGLAMCFEALVTDSDPGDPIRVRSFAWTLRWEGTGVILSEKTLTGRVCWTGEGVGADCGLKAPIPMVVRCVAELTNGDRGEAQREFWLVPQRGW